MSMKRYNTSRVLIKMINLLNLDSLNSLLLYVQTKKVKKITTQIERNRIIKVLYTFVSIFDLTKLKIILPEVRTSAKKKTLFISNELLEKKILY